MRICLFVAMVLGSMGLHGQALYNLDDLEFWPTAFAFTGDRMLVAGNSCEVQSGPGGPEGFIEKGHLLFVDEDGQREAQGPLSSEIRYITSNSDGQINVCSVSNAGMYCTGSVPYAAHLQIRDASTGEVDNGVYWQVGNYSYYPYVNAIRRTPNDGMLLMATSAEKVLYYTAPGDSIWGIDLDLPTDPATELWPDKRLNGIALEDRFIVNSWHHTPILRAYDYGGNLIWEREQSDWGFMVYDLHTGPQGRVYFAAKSLVDGVLVNPPIVGEFDTEGELLWSQEVTELLSPGAPMLALYPNGDLAVCATKIYTEGSEPFNIARFSADGAPLGTLTFTSSFTNFFDEYKLHVDYPQAMGVDSSGRVWVLNRSKPADSTLPLRFQVVMFDAQGNAPEPYSGLHVPDGAELVGIYNLLGQEVDHVKPNMLLLYRYSDGSVVKMVVEPD